MNPRIVIMIVGLASLFRLHAAEQPTRIVHYLFDGDGAKRRISITSFSGGPAIVTVSTELKGQKKEVTGQISSEDFTKIWTAFTSLPDLQKADITSSKATVDTDTHHVFFTLENSTAGSTSRSYGVLAAQAGPEFKSWLALLEPKPRKD